MKTLTEAEKQRMALNAAAMLALAQDKPVEQRHPNATMGQWVPLAGVLYYHPDERWDYRPAPDPTTRPWSFETRPMGVVWVFRIGFLSDRQITAWKDDGIEIGSYWSGSYEDLFDEWRQRDGSRCGITQAP